MAEVAIHPSARARISSNAKAKVMAGLVDCGFSNFTPQDVAEILADALGDAKAMCVLNGATQADLDDLSAREAQVYRRVLEPFTMRKEG